MSNQPDQDNSNDILREAQAVFEQLPTQVQAIYLQRLKEIANKQARVPSVRAIAD